MRIRRQSPAVHFAAKPVEVGFVEPPFEKRPCVDSGRTVALVVDQVARVFVGRRAKEVVEPDVVERRRRRKRRDVPTEIIACLIGAHHHCERVPTDQRTNAALHEQIARHEGFFVRRNRIAVRRGDRIRQTNAGSRHPRRQSLQQEVRAFGTLVVQQIFESIEPLASFVRIRVGQITRECHSFASLDRIQIIVSWPQTRRAAYTACGAVQCGDQTRCYLVGKHIAMPEIRHATIERIDLRIRRHPER